MRKYVAILVLILGCAFIVARHDEEAALEAAQKSAYKGNPASSTESNESHPQKHPRNAYWDSPSGQIFHSAFRWPEGITVWAIILTLLAIAEQTNQTRSAAEASRVSAEATRVQAEISRKAFISQFRPKVPVRAMWLTEKTGALTVEIWLTNTGDTPAHIVRSNITVGWQVPAELRKKIIASAVFQEGPLQPGQDHSVTIDITEIVVAHGVARIAVEEMRRDQEAWISCFGNLTYLDDNGTSRSTGFLRKYDIKRKRFVPSDDPEEEYAD